ncbi:uncharacterized protein FA14DRAFT_160595 [Meira miltonrushii]|uniref:Tyrosine specific protein phosphatases domain-containing protein n=1 Tax=Meira miltonrushii TaxID=1280837 RepID=A0A316VIX4_9BASI|nr:uncharacterized protein FA14DRAFT_160595 [Meira miltonrushii]PWN35455.1 hypothetical protein FA14DRAFT_160595 [Meira miltonrushii]
MIDAMHSETCSAQKSPTSGRSSIEQRSPRCAPYSIPSSESSSSLHSNHSRHSSNSNNNINPLESRQRPSHRSLPSFSKLAPSSTSNTANKSTSNGPTIARQHAHAAAPVVNTDQDSATRLANTAQSAIRSTAPQSKTSEAETSPKQEFTRRLSNSLNGLHVFSQQSSGEQQQQQQQHSEASELSSTPSDSSRSRSESVTSSLATSVSDGQSLGVSLSGSQSAFKQHQKALRNANSIQTSATVALQPPAPPENARGRNLGQGDSEARPEQHPNNASTRQDTTPNHTANANDFQQIPPTIEQRDALATRVYAACQAAGYDEWVRLLDLAPLASQHHLSGYNCIKFGQDGSPYAYLPLSLQQPVQVQEVLQKQKINEGKASEWLTHKRRKQGKSALGERPASQSNSNSSASSSDPSTPSSSTSTQNKAPKLMSKCDENGDTRMRNASPAPAQKEKCKACREMAEGSKDLSSVCECGPLKNEAALSSEWEAPIGKEVCKDTTETVQNGHTNQSSAQPNLTVKTSDTHPISISPIIPPELLEEISKHVSQAMPETLRHSKVNLFDADGIHETRHDDLQVDGKRLIRCRLTRVDMCEIAFKAERELIEASQSQRKPRSLRLDQPYIQEPPPSIMREAMMLDSKQPIVVDRGVYCQTSFDASNLEQDGEECHLNGLHSDVEVSQDPNPPPEDDKPFVMGNLLLSSCPGKKVRLTGPVRGRGAICRDLGLDLMRIRQLGVGAIVCCLDDEELAFLGAPWSQYETEADKLGIEVIRLPMAEGFSPTDVLATDKAISCVVNDYTLHGVHVLVHCRGGVGRAGLIACTWMLKLGLVRSDRDEVRFRIPMESLSCISPNESNTHPLTNWQNGGMIGDHQEKITMDIMQTIHRLIETIRRRRSPKAIETAEQVDFLVKYLLYLHEQERRHLCNSARLQSTAA